MPDILVWPQSTIPTWVSTATTTNQIAWQTWTSTPASTFNYVVYQLPHPYNASLREFQQQQLRQMHEANMAYQNQLNQQQLFERHAEAQAQRDYAATEAARVIQPNREAAAARARELLLQHLSEEQRRTFIEYKWFVVEGGRSKQRYRIRDKGDLVANVDALDRNGNVMARLCAHGRHDFQMPLADHLLTQKIMLELDEDSFLRIANRH